MSVLGSGANVDAGRLAFDTQGLASLKGAASSGGERQQEALEESARQFEALMLNMMLKQMRSATENSALTGSQQQEMMTSMLDQQLSQQLASVGDGIGLSKILIQQLSSNTATGTDSSTAMSPSAAVKGEPDDEQGAGGWLSAVGLTPEVGAAREDDWQAAVETRAADEVAGFMAMLDTLAPGDTARGIYAELPMATTGKEDVSATVSPVAVTDMAALSEQQRRQPENVQRFVAEFGPAAQAASRESGLPAELILAQAALETGWGERRIHTEAGTDSHNLFGIKAGSSWQGDSTTVLTTEYRDGRRMRLEDSFRVYPDQASALRDHAALLTGAQRYAHVTRSPDAESAARALQEAGYATDPHYADKLISIMSRVGPLEASGHPETAETRLATRDAVPASSSVATANSSSPRGLLEASAPLFALDARDAQPLVEMAAATDAVSETGVASVASVASATDMAPAADKEIGTGSESTASGAIQLAMGRSEPLIR
ncbi:flagellar assembly peptidoglycan hydrolase FlgJ [Cobetia sp. 4B]|uniref:flagellar assembly peptidoglycan hydrolase FlgJ n=1 Tax=Cobetia sp. 4B TaxID=2758724 RepID=UPI001C042DBA|nr:flagellar assembly peptidoglycan hydrolase FlgJ [Cobetia sp. 4B]MBR9754508.1 flagellar assembly peptidoglycan hydrolase FlgJ [Gammaproteobacteria bacterium]QWN35541.1 flagellar assembly peptidoglycan hydrolase FlgJ [Cobetia sp. 4B]